MKEKILYCKSCPWKIKYAGRMGRFNYKMAEAILQHNKFTGHEDYTHNKKDAYKINKKQLEKTRTEMMLKREEI